MTDAPGEHPPPHSGLQTQNPRIFVLAAGEILYRHHRKNHEPVFFGRTGQSRFDDPLCPDPSSFGVLYTGANPVTCLLESCGSLTGVPAVSGAYLEDRTIAKLELVEPLRFVDLASSAGLLRIGADSRLTTGAYKIAQLWSAELKHHPSAPDGIRYCSRRDPTQIAYAIFERPATAFRVSSIGSFRDDANTSLFRSILEQYELALLP